MRQRRHTQKDNLYNLAKELEHAEQKYIAEIIKYGLICNADFFAWLEQNMQALLNRDKQALTYAIEVSCQTKADVVSVHRYVGLNESAVIVRERDRTDVAAGNRGRCRPRESGVTPRQRVRSRSCAPRRNGPRSG